MCVRIYYQHICGHISPTVNEIRSCQHHNLTGYWERAQLPESQDQIDYCNAMCAAEPLGTTRTMGEDCPACTHAARLAAEAEAMRRDNEAFDRIRGAVVKPLPHKKRQARGGSSGDKKEGSSKSKK